MAGICRKCREDDRRFPPFGRGEMVQCGGKYVRWASTNSFKESEREIFHRACDSPTTTGRGGRDEAGQVEDEDAAQAGEEGPAELVHLALPEVREKGREDAGVDHRLARVGGVAPLPQLGVANCLDRALVGAAPRATDAVRDVVCAVVTSPRDPPAGELTGCA